MQYRKARRHTNAIKCPKEFLELFDKIIIKLKKQIEIDEQKILKFSV
jgi:hypothetical protein